MYRFAMSPKGVPFWNVWPERSSCTMRNEKQHRTSVYLILLVLAVGLTGIIVWIMSAPMTKSSWQASSTEAGGDALVGLRCISRLLFGRASGSNASVHFAVCLANSAPANSSEDGAMTLQRSRYLNSRLRPGIVCVSPH
jgi:hypothetical protein